MENRKLLIIPAAVAALLLIPFVAGFPWTMLDYIVMGILLSVTGLFIGLVWTRVKIIKYRILLFGVVLLVFFLVWAELAVGIFGTPFAGS